MHEFEQPETAISADVEGEPGGAIKVTLRGRLDVQTTGYCWNLLEERLRPLHPSSMDVEAGGLAFYGGIGVALVRYLSEGAMTPGATVSVRGLSEEVQRLLNTFTAQDVRTYKPKPPPRTRIPEEIGRGVKTLWRDLRGQIIFIGAATAGLAAVLRHPKQLRWSEVRHVFEVAGCNALPVVGFFSFLVGLIIALESAKPLAQFGAQIFIADMIAISALREAGPLVTAIMLAGRSSSAFAAELGTMKVNEELNALTTMGLDPVRFLVVQRLVAALALTPALTLYAMLMSILGGITVMRFLGFPPLMIYHQMLTQVQLSDLLIGLTKALVFGLIIGGVGCMRGLETEGGPAAVGASTTRAVVTSILLIFLTNTVIATVQYFMS
jgi:phospholipid/cholesterol/gamma-HCH transport system permease protein